MVEPAHARALHRRGATTGEPTEAAGEELDDDDQGRRAPPAAAAHRRRRAQDALDPADVEVLAGLVEARGDRWVLTAEGRLLANEVALRLRVRPAAPTAGRGR